MKRVTKRAIEDCVKTALSELVKIPKDELVLGKDWKHYNMDMLAVVELIMTIEDDFGIDELVVKDDIIKNPTQLINAVYKTIKQKGAKQ